MMLAYLVKEIFDDKDWLFEIKWDGYRALACKKKDIRLISRNNLLFNERFPSLISEIAKIPGSFILDGEIVMLDSKGKSHFQRLQNYKPNEQDQLYYYVFDILMYNGKDLTDLPLVKRKEILAKLIAKANQGHIQSHIRYSKHIFGKGIAFFTKAKKADLEGIIAKKADSTYQNKRSRNWLKIKTHKRQEVVIGGYTKPQASRLNFGALLVGVYEKGKLQYAGRIGTGFSQKSSHELFAKLKKLHRKTPPFAQAIKNRADIIWVKPELVCEVAFAEWTKDNLMRHASFQGLRMDKAAKKVRKEEEL